MPFQVPTGGMNNKDTTFAEHITLFIFDLYTHDPVHESRKSGRPEMDIGQLLYTVVPLTT